MKTYSAKAADIRQDWWHIDATNLILGRLASEAAKRLAGKHKPIYTPHNDTGDYLVITNAANIRVKGNSKPSAKHYYRHTGYPGGIKSISLEKLLAENPVEVVTTAIKGMLPKNSLGRKMLQKLKVYPGAEHPHSAQQPQTIDIQEAQ